ncbi:hypothetical protein [Pseudooceanicola sp.]|uniref:hypothetical protein n=1 Tax=Pseudooceanicola sp. TaxID=1914328 RepID=UPI00261598E3|nr:hypothetical protein [Pseudooceanicola sp.]
MLDGQEAEGTLSLQGQTRPLSFPFRLTISDGIGANLPDPAPPARVVTLCFGIEARRLTRRALAPLPVPGYADAAPAPCMNRAVSRDRPAGAQMARL